MSTINVVDLFCGAGGASTGIVRAVANMGHEIRLVTVDQWDTAIETHAQNHPHATHIALPMHEVCPLDYVRGNIDLLWASPPCTSHSTARGGRPCSEKSRGEAWCVLDWLENCNVKRVVIENVPQFRNWGPLGNDGHPIPSRAGETFRQFLSALKRRGYRVDWRLLCAADYGDPTLRRRLFIQAVTPPLEIQWPIPTHSETADMFAPAHRWLPASTIIDWSIPGEPISQRQKPLCTNTMRRIESGIKKYWKCGGWAEPFLVSLRGTNESNIENSAQSIDSPTRTILASGIHDSIVLPFIIDYHGMSNHHSIGQPLNTLGTRNQYAIVHGDGDRIGVAYRMLAPHELAAAQGFPKYYRFCGKLTDEVRQIGNAVPVNTAAALCWAALGGMQ